ncbi:endothelin-converting enzyme 2-like [Meleagris gallopavo]|uniref:endothelin-converting enzyme 2-like n=1 Tax=Meleagris gallopavo TaxID=9103 RepID=UPI000939F577|nr:endothelin-converting enzyme 2-like [Meleagris gallopavo]
MTCAKCNELSFLPFFLHVSFFSLQTCDQELGTGTKKERCLQEKSLLLCALLLSTLLGFALLITYITMTCALGSCDVEPSLALLARLLNSRNDTVDPCEDFYKYACGSWEGKHSSTEVSGNIFDALLEENQLILKRLLGRKRQLVWYLHHLPQSEMRIPRTECTTIPVSN